MSLTIPVRLRSEGARFKRGHVCTSCHVQDPAHYALTIINYLRMLKKMFEDFA